MNLKSQSSCMQVKTEEKRKVGKGGSKKRKELGHESPLASMFQKQQTINDLNIARESYNTPFQKGKELGLDEAVYDESMFRSENDTRPIV